MEALISAIAGVIYFLLLIYFITLIARLVLDYIPLFNPGWRPHGFMLVVAVFAMTLTDPPIKFFRRLIPPLRIGPLALDFGYTLTMVALFILMSIVGAFR